MSCRVAVDIGGTFTDFVSLDEESGELYEEKASTTPVNFAEGVINAIRKSGISMADVNYFVHGCTVVVNALTERKGAKTAFITTEGFRDILEIQRANRPALYDFNYKKPEPYVPRRYSYEVNERLDFNGDVLIELAEDNIQEIIGQLKENGIEAVGVCLLHSYANPVNEKRLGEILRDEMPEIDITLSHEIIRTWREYERANTTVMNAYVMPSSRLYLNTLKEELKEKLGLEAEPHAMQSNGGTATFSRAKSTPISLVESGPVGGVIGANELGKIIGEKNIISFDIGGTTAKTSLIYNNNITVNTEYRFESTPTYAGYPILTPVCDIIEIGAGGGSKAWIDDVGALKVGPESAGAVPGPACYGLGGEDPTLTDANIITGRIDPENFLGGEMKVDRDLSYKSIKPIADYYNISVKEAAMGIISIANNNMMNALRLISVRRGYNPQEFIMVAMGGNGSIFGPYLARELNVKKLVIPNMPATFSAFGMLMTDLRQDFMQTKIIPADNCDLKLINDIYHEMEKEAIKLYEQQHIKPDDVMLVRSADIRYVGQEHAVHTPVTSGKLLKREDIEISRNKFDELHNQHFSFKLTDDPVEFVNFNLTVYGIVQKPELKKIEKTGNNLDFALKGKREIEYENYGLIETNVYERGKLSPEMEIEGPAVVEESKSVTLIYPDDLLSVDDYGNLIIYFREVE
jgi:N-methylhydantoinase A